MRRHLLFLFLGISAICFGQKTVTKTSERKNIDKMKQFFYKLDDAFNLAMVKKDSSFFANSFDNSFINCTPQGEINSKSEEISTLLKLPFIHVERTALKYDIFTFSDKIATMSVTKKLTRKDSTAVYVRRTIIFEFIEGKWLIASGQGTVVLSKYID